METAKWNTLSFIACFSVVAAFLLLVLWTFYPPVGEAQQVFTMINTLAAGLFGTCVGSIFGYFFGSSSSSKEKDETISNMAKNPGGGQPTPPPVTRETIEGEEV